MNGLPLRRYYAWRASSYEHHDLDAEAIAWIASRFDSRRLI